MVFRTFSSGCKVRQVCQAWFSVHFQTLSLAWRVRTFVPGLSGRCPQEFGLALPCIRTPACCPSVVRTFAPRRFCRAHLEVWEQPVGSPSWGPCPSLGDRILVPRTLSGRCPYVVRTLSGAHVQVRGVASWPQNVFQTLSLRYVL